MTAPSRLLDFVASLAQLVEAAGDRESVLLPQAGSLMRKLVEADDWLPEAFSQPDPRFYRQFLLYADPLDRFSVVSFVWGPGQSTPIHDHTVWGVIGMLRGAECAQNYDLDDRNRLRPRCAEARLAPGEVEMVSPTLGDVHRVRNAYDDRVSVSIHAYGGNIGRIRRSAFDASTGTPKAFVSGYSNAMVPNLWADAA